MPRVRLPVGAGLLWGKRPQDALRCGWAGQPHLLFTWRGNGVSGARRIAPTMRFIGEKWEGGKESTVHHQQIFHAGDRKLPPIPSSFRGAGTLAIWKRPGAGGYLADYDLPTTPLVCRSRVYRRRD